MNFLQYCAASASLVDLKKTKIKQLGWWDEHKQIPSPTLGFKLKKMYLKYANQKST